ncbi:hypothetical protein B0H13DRAFT_1911543 [Mycena leptocephala]|nr:hypothetical protein B0H13DRAFT_1911543 [Mycena leptocephala]
MSDWIGQEHSMASVPPRVHRMAKDVFAIPQEFHFEILPSSMLPITEIREFSAHPPELSRVANTKKIGATRYQGALWEEHYTPSVQFSRPRHASPEHLVEMIQSLGRGCEAAKRPSSRLIPNQASGDTFNPKTRQHSSKSGLR